MFISSRVPAIDFDTIETPCYVIDRGALASNLALLERVDRKSVV